MRSARAEHIRSHHPGSLAAAGVSRGVLEQAVRHLLHRELSVGFSSWRGAASEVAERERVQRVAAARMTRGEVYAALSQWRSRHAEASQLRRVVSRMVSQRTGRAYSSWVEAARERAYALDLVRRASSSGLRQDLAWASLCVPVPVRSGDAAFLHMLMLFWVRVGSARSLNLCFVRCSVCTCLCQGDGSRPMCQNSAFRT